MYRTDTSIRWAIVRCGDPSINLQMPDRVSPALRQAQEIHSNQYFEACPVGTVVVVALPPLLVLRPVPGGVQNPPSADVPTFTILKCMLVTHRRPLIQRFSSPHDLSTFRRRESGVRERHFRPETLPRTSSVTSKRYLLLSPNFRNINNFQNSPKPPTRNYYRQPL